MTDISLLLPSWTQAVLGLLPPYYQWTVISHVLGILLLKMQPWTGGASPGSPMDTWGQIPKGRHSGW